MEERLVLLVIEPEQPEGLSARKLVLETARHNVLSAYSGAQGLSLFRRFPNIDVAVVHSGLNDLSCEEVSRRLKRQRPELPIVVVSPAENTMCEDGDHVVPSHDPQALLNLLAEEFGASKSN